MPHVILNGSISIEDVFNSLLPFTIRDENYVLRTLSKYINTEKTSILVEALSIEKDGKIAFLVVLGNREDGLVIRIYPELDIKKTDGVKKILAELAKQTLQKFPNLTIGKTNLQDFLSPT